LEESLDILSTLF